MSIETRELSAETWGKYFESIAPDIEGLLVTVELMSDELGDQTDVERRYPIVLRHFISSPQTISVEEAGPPTPSAILVTDSSGVRTLIRLLEPTVLEA
jgi:hypothetical protein